MSDRWRTLTVADREREYSPSSCLPDGDYGPFIERYRQASRDAWAELLGTPDARTATVRYGAAAEHTIDLAVPTTTAVAPPLLVFIHGGYWQELSKVDSRFAAADSVAQGWAFAAVDYTLAPAADLATIVGECRRAVSALHAEAPTHGFDPSRVYVAGSSAGAHLAAMVAVEAGQAVTAGAVLVSGIFDLEPLVGTTINDALGLDAATAVANSPIHVEPVGFPPTVVAYGEHETDEFKAQSHDFAGWLDRAGAAVTLFEVPDRNHFDVILDLARPATRLGGAVATLIESTSGPDAQL